MNQGHNLYLCDIATLCIRMQQVRTCPTNGDVYVDCYLDDELGSAGRARFEEHLVFCPQCARELAEFAIMQKFIRAVFTPRQQRRFKESYN